MPSLIGHSLMGYMIYRVTAQPVGVKRWQLLGLSLLAANAADLDFIPGFLIGDPSRYHNGISHSIGFAVLWGALCGLWLGLTKRAAVGRAFALFFTLYTSHLVLDWLSHEVRFLWPLSDTYYIAPFAFWLNIHRADSSGAFFLSLLSLHNLRAVTVECLVLVPAILLMEAWRNLTDGSAEASPQGGRSFKS
jgi:inner membrane protein